MPPGHPAHTIDALFAVGRNVVSFQRLEQILKQLALFAPLYATPATLQSEVENRVAGTERLTLGSAVKKWIESEFHITQPKQGKQLDQEIVSAFGFGPRTPENFDRLSCELESLAQERNSLIHLDLAQLNLADEAECTALSIRLDAQNDRIIRAIEILGPIRERMQELARLIASDEGLMREMLNPALVEKDPE